MSVPQVLCLLCQALEDPCRTQKSQKFLGKEISLEGRVVATLQPFLLLAENLSCLTHSTGQQDKCRHLP